MSSSNFNDRDFFPVAERRGSSSAVRRSGRDLMPVEFGRNAGYALSDLSSAARNYSEALKISSKGTLIRAHEALQDTVRKSTLSERRLREILGPDYEDYL